MEFFQIGRGKREEEDKEKKRNEKIGVKMEIELLLYCKEQKLEEAEMNGSITE